jgi:flagellar M-ring protein FliF
MNEWFKKVATKATELWSKWTPAQKLIGAGIAVAAIVAIVFVFSLSSTPTTVPIFNVAITDESARDSIIYRLEQENVTATVSSTGIISVKDEATARRMRAILVREDLVPGNVDPWALFDVQRWTVTDLQEKVNVQRSVTQAVKQHIEALDDVDRANIVLTMPAKMLFSSQQSPATASVILYAKPGSDISTNKKKIEGVQKLLLVAVEGLKAENVSIADSSGTILNDFEGMEAITALDIVAKQQKLIASMEGQYRANVLVALQKIFGDDRVRDLNVKLEMDMSKRQQQSTEYSAITLVADNPDTPYDDSQIVETLPITSTKITEEWNGTFYSPEGPPGAAGQNPPVYTDMTNQIGTSKKTSETQTNALNSTMTQSEKSPSVDRVTVSVNIDGTWKKKYDERGNVVLTTSGSIDREYVPLDARELEQATNYVRSAVGYSQPRGDSVTVTNIQFDRTSQFEVEDAAYRKTQQTRFMFMMLFAGIAALIVFIILFRAITPVLKRKRERKAEETAMRQATEASLLGGEPDITIEMSEDDRRRAQLQETITMMAQTHPEDVALLIKTMLAEE